MKVQWITFLVVQTHTEEVNPKEFIGAPFLLRVGIDSQAVVAHILNPRIWEAEPGGSLGSWRPSWYTMRVPGSQGYI